MLYSLSTITILKFTVNKFHKLLTRPVGISQVNDYFPVEGLVERPYKDVRQEHQKANYQATAYKNNDQK